MCAEKGPAPLEVQLLLPGEMVTAFMAPGGSFVGISHQRGPVPMGFLWPPGVDGGVDGAEHSPV